MMGRIGLTTTLLQVALFLTGCGTSSAPTSASDIVAVDDRGAYRMDYPIPAPPFHGLEPTLRLTYDSLNGNGWVGVGWRISGLTTISRVSPGKGVPTYTASDLYLLDGMELVPCSPVSVSPSCRYRSSPTDLAYSTRIENFERIAFDPNTKEWRLWNKTGIKRTYAPRPFDPALGPFRWDLATVEDPLGHEVVYQTVRDSPPTGSGETYIDTISYNGFQLKFYYEDRPDSLSYSNGRDLISVRRRLKALDITARGARSSLYELEYGVRDYSGRSFLHAIRRFGTDALINASGAVTNLTTVLTEPATMFELPASSGDTWSVREVTNTQWGLPQDGGPMPPVVNGLAFTVPTPFRRFTGSNLGDVDGNGQTDWIQAAPDLQLGPARHTSLLITTALAGKRPPIDVQQILTWPFTGLIKTSFAADVNGDGRSDLVFLLLGPTIPAADPNSNPHFLQIAVALSKGDGTYDWAVTTSSGQDTQWETRESTYNRITQCMMGDVDGDAREDMLCSFTKEDGTHFLGTALSNGDGTFAISEMSMPFAVQGETRLMAVGDVNGDGLIDPMFLDFPHCPDTKPDCTVKYDIVTAFSKGNGEYEIERATTPWDRGSPLFFAADVDGDGRADYLVSKSVPEDSTDDGAFLTAIRQPDGTYRFAEQPIPAALRTVEHSFAVGDANGDGKTDLLVISRQEPGKLGCSTVLTGVHVNLHRVLSNGDGHFDFPSTWEDCSNSSELPIAWDEVHFTPVEPQAADLNGDGTADFLIAAATNDGTLVTHLWENLSAHPKGDTYNWLPAELNGDGRKDWIYVRATTTGPLIETMLSDGTGYRTAAWSPVPGTQELTALRNWRVFDVNGDGLDDLVYLRYITPAQGIEVSTWFADGHGGWRYTSQQVFVGLVETFRATTQWRVVDANGDGRGDLVYLTLENSSLSTLALLSNGDGTWTEKRQTQFLPWTLWDLRAWHTGDLNGDGRTDLVHIANSKPGAQVQVLLAQGDGTWAAPRSMPVGVWNDLTGAELFDTLNWKMLDFNGDGLSDLVHLSPSTRFPDRPATVRVQSLISHGDGGFTPLDETPSTTFSGEMQNWRVASVNRDERQDLVHFTVRSSEIDVNTLSFSTNSSWNLSVPTTSKASGPRDSAFNVADIDGDGSDDLTRFDLQSPGMRILSLQARFPDDLLTRVVNKFGGATDITYRGAAISLANDTSESCRLPSGVAFETVDEIRTSDGRAAQPAVQSLNYACARWSRRERAFLGWEDRYTSFPGEPARPASTTFNHQVITDECFTQPAFTQEYDSSGRVYRQIVTAWARRGATAPYRCLLNYEDEIQLDNASVGLNVITYYGYDEFGNTTGIFEYGADAESNNDERTTTILYHPNTTAYIVGLPFEVTVSDGIPVKKTQRYTYYCYDGDNGSDSSSCLGSITKGQLTAIKAVNRNGWYDTTTLTYDAFGNVAAVTDPNHHGQTMFYDPDYHLFPKTVCDALGHCLNRDWDIVLGVVKGETDENGQFTQTQFDALGRPKVITLPDGATLNIDYVDFGDPVHQRIRTTLSDGGATSLWSDEYLDALGRTYSTVRKGADGAEYVLDAVFLGATMLPKRRSHWYTRGDTPVFEDFEYDVLSRPRKQTHPDGTFTELAYDNTATESTVTRRDELGHVRTLVNDAYGRLSGVRERLKGKDLSTHYTYDAADQLLTTADAAGNTTTLNWDVRGNITSTSDPDRGARTYDDDYVGNVTRMVDAKGSWTRYTYDALDRLSVKQYPSSREVHLVYDEAGHGASIGRLTSVIDWSEYKCPIKSGYGYLAEERFYDVRGRLSSLKRCIEGVTTEMQFTWDKLDRLHTITYPDGDVVTYGYDDAGRPESVSGWVSKLEYNAANQITSAEFANGTQQSYSYDRRREWLTDTGVANNTRTLLEVGYRYYPNVLPRSTRSYGTTINYGYDELNRLVSVKGSGRQGFNFDGVGNILSNSAIGTYSYTGSGCGSSPAIPCPHAVKSAGNSNFTYDENGNLSSVQTLIGGVPKQRTIGWNVDAEAASFVDYNGIVTKLRYDNYGERVYRERDGVGTHFYGPWLELSQPLAGGTPLWTQYYYAGSLLIGRKDSSGSFWFHRDRLGSVRMLTDSTGAVAGQSDYGPFGVLQPGAVKVNSDIQFTGHRSDEANDVIDMRARLYEPDIGRFISPDPTIPDLANPESLNPFSYAYNSPVANFEPSGLHPVDAGVSQNISPARKGFDPVYTNEQIYRYDDLGLKFWFNDNAQGWREFQRAERAIRQGMKDSDLFNQAMWKMLRGSGPGKGTKLNVQLESARAQLKGGENAEIGDIQGAGANHFMIQLMPSGKINTTVVQRRYLRMPGDLDLPDGGLRDWQVAMPASLETSLWHEIGHAFGAFETGMPVQSAVDRYHPINQDAIRFVNEAYRVFDTSLDVGQTSTLEKSVHVLP